MPVIKYPSRGLCGVCPAGETILEAIRSMGYTIDHACGGNARCGTCCVKVIQGMENLSPVGAAEATMLMELQLGAPHRLSCQARVTGDIIVLPGI